MVMHVVELSKSDTQSHFYQIFECPVNDKDDTNSHFVWEVTIIIASN